MLPRRGKPLEQVLAEMNDNVPESTAPTIRDRERLGDRLEAENKRMVGVQREHFVDQRSLCTSCKYASIMRQSSKNARNIYCNQYSKLMPEDVAECTDYAAFGSLSLSQMADIATLIDDRPDRYRGYL
jgi:hypothetical protein